MVVHRDVKIRVRVITVNLNPGEPMTLVIANVPKLGLKIAGSPEVIGRAMAKKLRNVIDNLE